LNSPKTGFITACVVFLLTSFAAAATLTGTVKNGTTNRPGAGDDIVLLSLGQGMEEVGRTKADAKGNFSFELKEEGPHLVRAIHQGVTYHKMAPPGTTSAEVTVYDVSKKLDAISVTADVMRIQAENNQLEVVRLFAVNNESSPPRTQMNDHNFEFYLPEGAKIDQSMAMTAGGQPISSAPVPQAEKNRYAFIFPLRPGETQFQIQYHLPYSGEATIDPKTLYPMQHFVVMLPKSMKFTPAPGTPYESKPYPNQPNTQAQVAATTRAGQPLSFQLSGTGILQTESQGGGGQGGESAQGRDSRPGGGLGAPIDAPDPLQQYRWYILGGFAAVLAVGAFFVVRRQPGAAPPQLGSGNGSGRLPAAAASAALDDYEAAATQAPRRRDGARAGQSRPTATTGGSALLLEALKEEIFQLEIDRKQGRVSAEEYEKSKAALDHTLERALKRESQK
jgi:hypothetical protein